MKHFFIILILMLCINVNAQVSINCMVLDSATKLPVSFVNIGIANSNTSTISNESGAFKLQVADSLKNKKVKISSIGYNSIELPLFNIESVIYLIPQKITLKEVKIVYHKIRQTVLGNKTKSKNLILAFESNTPGAELATKITIKHKQTFLKKINVNILHNPYKDAQYRINIYNLDKKENPNENILQESIIGFIPNEKGLIEIDISKYNIIVNSDVCISIEQITNLTDKNTTNYLSVALGASPINKQIQYSAQLSGRTLYRYANTLPWESLPIGFGLWVDAEY